MSLLSQVGPYKKLILLAIFIRLLVMPFYLHPDIKTYHFQASFLKKGIFNIYTYLAENRQTLPLKEEFVYFPLAYFSLGGYQMLMSPLLGINFDGWLSDCIGLAATTIGSYRYLFLLKLPYLILDIIAAFILMSLFVKEEDKKKVFTLWLFNPFTIVLIYVFANIDIIPVVLTLASLYFFRKDRYLLSGSLIGLASGFKTYPMLFLPFLLIKVNDSKNRLKILVSTLGIFFMIILPFFSKSFYSLSFAQ